MLGKGINSDADPRHYFTVICGRRWDLYGRGVLKQLSITCLTRSDKRITTTMLHHHYITDTNDTGEGRPKKSIFIVPYMVVERMIYEIHIESITQIGRKVQ